MNISKKIVSARLLARLLAGLLAGLLAVLLLAQHVSAGPAPAGENVTFTFNLQKGWNLISLPVLASYTAESFGSFIGSDVKYIITTVNATSSEQKTYVAGVSGKESDFEVKPDYGYFVFVISNCKLTVTGQRAGVRNVALYKGLNLVGWTSLEKSTAVDAFAAPLGSNLINVSKRNSDGSFQTYTVNVSQKADNFIVEPGSGYLLYAERDCTLTYGSEGGPAGEILQPEPAVRGPEGGMLRKTPVSGKSIVPGFEAGILIAGLLGAALLIQKMKR